MMTLTEIKNERRPTSLRSALLIAATLFASPLQAANSIPLPPADIPGVSAGVQMAQSSADIAQQSMRIDALENNMRNLTGKIDELTYQMQQIQDMLKRMQEDNEFRFKELEGGKKRSSIEPSEEPASAEAEPSFADNVVEPAPVEDTGEAVPTDLSQGFSIDPNVDPTQSGISVDDAVAPQVLGTLPADAPVADGALDGPLDLSALARGDAPTETATLEEPIAGAIPPDVKPALPSVGSALPDVGTQVADIIAPSDPRAAYEQAYNYILAGNYARAEASFKQFLADYPENKRASDATYWLGESFYARKQFRDAADNFLTTYRDFPRSAKAPDSLLKLGLSLEGLGQKDAACATYGELERKYPSASPALLTQLADKKTSAGC